MAKKTAKPHEQNDMFSFSEEEINRLTIEIQEDKSQKTTNVDYTEYADFLEEEIPDIDFSVSVLPIEKEQSGDSVEEKPAPQYEIVEGDMDFLKSEGSTLETSENAQEGSKQSDYTQVGDGQDKPVQDGSTPNSEPDNSDKKKPKMKIKEIKYGMTVITNIGNYENIRTHIEATAEIESNDDFLSSVEELSSQIRSVGRSEYKAIKRKNAPKNVIQSNNNQPVYNSNQNSNPNNQGMNVNQNNQRTSPPQERNVQPNPNENNHAQPNSNENSQVDIPKNEHGTPNDSMQDTNVSQTETE